MTRTRALGVLWLGVASALAPACHNNQLTGPACRQDSDCTQDLLGSPASAWQCDTSTGTCLCRTDQACQSSQFCNTDGYCQDRSGCQTNQDCGDPSLYCDTTTGTCLSVGRCAEDIQCPLGQVCDLSSETCVPGCRSNGDCAETSCLCGDGGCTCTATTQAERQSCPIGVCNGNFCSNENYCQYGQQCAVIPDSGIPYSECYSDYDPNLRPYCAACTFGPGVVNTCGQGPNFCLIDTVDVGAYYCGSDCSQGQTCPRGYSCQDVIVVGLPGTTQCTPSSPAGGLEPGICPPSAALPCTQDSQCPFGGTCQIPTGQDAGSCGGLCSSGEGDKIGFCTCLSDFDCPSESCNGGECNITRQPCITASDCHFIHCVDFQGAGGCWVGENCAPSDGLTCLEIR